MKMQHLSVSFSKNAHVEHEKSEEHLARHGSSMYNHCSQALLQ
jgi:hypothetical protein